MKIVIMIFTLFSIVYATEPKADVLAVYFHEKEHGFKFGVKLQSDETGCEQYADWWEILNAEGELLYRRILVHSHPDTQPFTRWSLKVLKVSKSDLLYIRGHMNQLGYNGNVFKGSIKNGFKEAKTFPDFNVTIETQSPLPQGCLY